MSNLLNTEEGRSALLVSQKFLLQRRMSRFFKRNIEIDINAYREGQEFDLGKMLGSLNPAHDAEILEIYRLLAAVGGLERTIADLTYYISPTTGSDSTGTGSSARPYASLWFVKNLPKTIAHKVRVLITSNLDASTTDLDLAFRFEAGGSFALAGAAAPTVISSGHVYVGHGSLGGLGGVAVEVLNPWPPNTSRNFVRVNGANPRAFGVHTSAAEFALSQTLPATYGGPPADPMDVIRPAVNLKLRSLHTHCSGVSPSWSYDQYAVPLAIVNLILDFPNSSYTHNRVNLHDDCYRIISFVKITNQFSDYQGMSIKGGALNTNSLVDRDLKALTLCGIENIENAPAGGTPYNCGLIIDNNSTDELIEIEGATVFHIDTQCGVVLRGRTTLSLSCVGQAVLRNAIANVHQVIANGKAGEPLDSGGGVELYDSSGKIEFVTTLSSDNCITLRGGSICRIARCGSDAIFSNILNAGVFGIHVNFGCSALYNDGAGITPLTDGLTGAVTDLAGYEYGVGQDNVAWGILNAYTLFGKCDITITE